MATITRNQIRKVLIGWFDECGGAADPDPCEILADALEQRARERRAEGRSDIAGRLTWAEGRIRNRMPLTKRVKDALRKDLDLITERLCT